MFLLTYNSKWIAIISLGDSCCAVNTMSTGRLQESQYNLESDHTLQSSLLRSEGINLNLKCLNFSFQVCLQLTQQLLLRTSNITQIKWQTVSKLAGEQTIGHTDCWTVGFFSHFASCSVSKSKKRALYIMLHQSTSSKYQARVEPMLVV